MRYVLLLRGINVGGKNKVVMRELKEQLAQAGFEAVDSYINSGNLFFTSALSQAACAEIVAQVLTRHYDFAIPFALIDREAYLAERAALPAWWHESLARRDVLFASQHMDLAAIIDFVQAAEFHNEIVHIGQQAVFWGKYDESEYLKTTYHKKLMKQPFYRLITIRNGNTFEKIAEILERD